MFVKLLERSGGDGRLTEGRRVSGAYAYMQPEGHFWPPIPMTFISADHPLPTSLTSGSLLYR
jgi:hypothetical protein